jgi:hypothetical protein
MVSALVEDIVRAVYKVQSVRMVKPAVLRCHPKVSMALLAEGRPEHIGATFGQFVNAESIGTWPDGTPVTFPGAFDPRLGALGLKIEQDMHLPVDVWRLCDADQTLLYDCREGASAL